MVIMLFTEMVVSKPGKMFISKTSGQTRSRSCLGAKREILQKRLGHMYNPNYVADSLDDITLQTADLSKSLARDSKNMTSLLRHRRGSDVIYTPDAWTCKATYEWIDLGWNHFPRYYKKATCSSSTCWFGHYKCRRKYFHLKFFKLKAGATCKDVINIPGLPLQVDKLFTMIDKKIPMYCACVL